MSLRLQHIEQKVEGKATVESVNMTWCQRGEQIMREGGKKSSGGGGGPNFFVFFGNHFFVLTTFKTAI